MSLSADIVWEVRPGGSDTNGGGRSAAAAGSDFTQQDAAQTAVTDGVTNGTAVITSATANFDAGGDDEGHLVYVAGGTGAITGDWYEIISRDSATQITVDRSTGLTAGTGVTLNIGGALATPGLAAKKATVSGHKIWVKSGTYTLSTTTPGAGGPVLFASNIDVSMEGYSVTRGDRAATPTVDAGAQTSINIFSCQGTSPHLQQFISMKADGNAGASVNGFNATLGGDTFDLCVAFDCVNGFLSTGNQAYFALRCFADTCSTTGFVFAIAMFCAAKSCGVGFTFSAARTPDRCIAYSCTTDGFQWGNAGNTNPAFALNCTADSNGSNGINFSGNRGRAFNCLVTNHSGGGDTGIASSGASLVTLINCAGYNNTTNFSGTFYENSGSIALTANPYVDQAGADFHPNATVGGGASLRAAGIGIYGQTNAIDVGAVQHADPARARYHLGM